MKKKTLSILFPCIALFAALALVGCGGGASSGGGSDAATNSKEKAPQPQRPTLSGLRSRCPRALA